MAGRIHAVPISPGVTAPFAPRHILEGLREGSLFPLGKPCDLPKYDGEVTIRDVVYVASYNWVDAAHPTIVVPGSPRLWVERPLPFLVQPDYYSSQIHVDQHAYRMPQNPMLPMFRAADIMMALEPGNSTIDWSSVDIVTDRNSLRKLLRWIDFVETGAYWKRPPWDFRIDTQLVGQKTIILQRWQESAFQTVDWGSYGETYETAATRSAEGFKGSLGHHRIIKYDFDGLIMVVRYECDAAKEDSQSAWNMDDDDLSGILSALSVSARTLMKSEDIKVLRGGEVIAQDAIVELKTHKEGGRINWKKTYPQLFLSQTSHCHVATHSDGLFHNVTKHESGDACMTTYAGTNEARLRQLRRVLEHTREIVVEEDVAARLSLVCQNGWLDVRQRIKEDDLLPKDVLARFVV